MFCFNLCFYLKLKIYLFKSFFLKPTHNYHIIKNINIKFKSYCKSIGFNKIITALELFRYIQYNISKLTINELNLYMFFIYKLYNKADILYYDLDHLLIKENNLSLDQKFNINKLKILIRDVCNYLYNYVDYIHENCKAPSNEFLMDDFTIF